MRSLPCRGSQKGARLGRSSVAHSAGQVHDGEGGSLGAGGPTLRSGGGNPSGAVAWVHASAPCLSCSLVAKGPFQNSRSVQNWSAELEAGAGVRVGMGRGACRATRGVLAAVLAAEVGSSERKNAAGCRLQAGAAEECGPCVRLRQAGRLPSCQEGRRQPGRLWALARS